MRRIRKGLPPAGFIEVSARPGATYEDLTNKRELRQALVAEQRGLCCYCLRRIAVEEEGFLPRMKVAHWRSQKLHAEDQLSYRNLLGACKGGEGTPPSKQHCDTFQRHRDIKWNPADPSHPVEASIYFGSNGTIYSQDADFNQQLNEVLNLNLEALKTERKLVLHSFLDSLGTGELSRDKLKRFLQKKNGEADVDELDPHCQIVVVWLRKKLAKP